MVPFGRFFFWGGGLVFWHWTLSDDASLNIWIPGEKNNIHSFTISEKWMAQLLTWKNCVWLFVKIIMVQARRRRPLIPLYPWKFQNVFMKWPFAAVFAPFWRKFKRIYGTNRQNWGKPPPLEIQICARPAVMKGLHNIWCLNGAAVQQEVCPVTPQILQVKSIRGRSWTLAFWNKPNGIFAISKRPI